MVMSDDMDEVDEKVGIIATSDYSDDRTSELVLIKTSPPKSTHPLLVTLYACESVSKLRTLCSC